MSLREGLGSPRIIASDSRLLGTVGTTPTVPKGGSCAMTLTLFADHTKYRYHFNDLDPHLFAVLSNVNGYLEFKADVIQMYNDFNRDHSIESTDRHPHLAKLWKSTAQSIDSPFTNFYVNEKFIRSALFKISKDNPDMNHVAIFEKATKTHEDYKIVMEQYRWDEEAFVFLDPPYLFSDNSGYYPPERRQRHDRHYCFHFGLFRVLFVQSDVNHQRSENLAVLVQRSHKGGLHENVPTRKEKGEALDHHELLMTARGRREWI